MSIRRILSVSALAAAALTLFVTPAANADGCGYGYGRDYVVHYDHYAPRYVQRHRPHHYRHRHHRYVPRYDYRPRRAQRRSCRW